MGRWSMELPDEFDPERFEETYKQAEKYYRHYDSLDIFMSEGVYFFAVAWDAYWLIDTIARAQSYWRVVSPQTIQFWRLAGDAGRRVTIIGEDGSDHQVFRRREDREDCKVLRAQLIFAHHTILFPWEY